MGGLGSGRLYYWNCKSKTEDYRSLDIRKWARQDAWIPGLSFTCKWFRGYEQTSEISIVIEADSIRLIYSYRDAEYNWTNQNYSVRVVWTTCNYGGKRPWFLCPALGCGKRVAVLYGGEIFACRKCYKLAYKCQSESASSRATRRADKIREQLNWEPGILNGEGIKPKGMHWSTFERLFNQHQHFVNSSLLEVLQRYDLRSHAFNAW